MKEPHFVEIDGFRLPPSFDPKIFRDAVKYKPENGRIVVATYPKCGTTWTLQIVTLLLRRGIPPENGDEYFSLMPFMEMTPLNELQNLSQDACIKTHLPFNRITFSNDVKYIYVARQPSDCMVSFYHHVKYFPEYFFSDGTFDDFFEVFITGGLDFGDYFDHILSWYEHRNKPNILFITFESLKADLKGTILKIAKFMGNDIYEDLLRDGEKVLSKVLEYSGLEYMKNTVEKYFEEFAGIPTKELQEANPVMKNYADLLVKAAEAGHFSVGKFIRKGGVGDGKIILSEEQRLRLQARIREKCGDSDIMTLWGK